MQLLALDARIVSLALRTTAVHARASRSRSESVFVTATAEGGVTGIGETIARHYVTGETNESVLECVDDARSRLLGEGHDVAGWLTRLGELAVKAQADRATAAFAAIETAVLDALAQTCGEPLGALLGIRLPQRIEPTLAIVTSSLSVAAHLARAAGELGAGRIKIKVGLPGDIERVMLVRESAPGTEIWADANGAWTFREALDRVRALGECGVSVVEQPVAADERRALGIIERETGVRISADESLVTYRDASTLLELRSCGVWNLRVAKCGGIRSTIALAELARRHGIDIQIGAMVGESSVLGAAALWVAGALGPGREPAFEACQGPRLLRRDPGSPRLVTIGPLVPRLRPTGLGVRIER